MKDFSKYFIYLVPRLIKYSPLEEAGQIHVFVLIVSVIIYYLLKYLYKGKYIIVYKLLGRMDDSIKSSKKYI